MGGPRKGNKGIKKMRPGASERNELQNRNANELLKTHIFLIVVGRFAGSSSPGSGVNTRVTGRLEKLPSQTDTPDRTPSRNDRKGEKKVSEKRIAPARSADGPGVYVHQAALDETAVDANSRVGGKRGRMETEKSYDEKVVGGSMNKQPVIKEIALVDQRRQVRKEKEQGK